MHPGYFGILVILLVAISRLWWLAELLAVVAVRSLLPNLTIFLGYE